MPSYYPSFTGYTFIPSFLQFHEFSPSHIPLRSDFITVMGRLIDKELPYKPETPLRLVVVGLSRTGTACKCIMYDSFLKSH